jgi:hypothetical protein
MMVQVMKNIRLPVRDFLFHIFLIGNNFPPMDANGSEIDKISIEVTVIAYGNMNVKMAAVIMNVVAPVICPSFSGAFNNFPKILRKMDCHVPSVRRRRSNINIRLAAANISSVAKNGSHMSDAIENMPNKKCISFRIRRNLYASASITSLSAYFMSINFCILTSAPDLNLSK